MTQLEGQSVTGYRMVIPQVPLSPNQLLGRHWRAKFRHKKLWMQELSLFKPFTRYWKPFPAEDKMRVRITIHNASQYDRDNAWGACKPILDAMKALGLIVDDRAAYCDLTVLQEKSTRKEKRTVIEVGPAT